MEALEALDASSIVAASFSASLAKTLAALPNFTSFSGSGASSLEVFHQICPFWRILTWPCLISSWLSFSQEWVAKNQDHPAEHGRMHQ